MSFRETGAGSDPTTTLSQPVFFGVARSLRIDLDMFVARALKNSQLTPRPRGESHAYFGDRTPDRR